MSKVPNHDRPRGGPEEVPGGPPRVPETTLRTCQALRDTQGRDPDSLDFPLREFAQRAMEHDLLTLDRAGPRVRLVLTIRGECLLRVVPSLVKRSQPSGP